jgi:hypothetical protein
LRGDISVDSPRVQEPEAQTPAGIGPNGVRGELGFNPIIARTAIVIVLRDDVRAPYIMDGPWADCTFHGLGDLYRVSELEALSFSEFYDDIAACTAGSGYDRIVVKHDQINVSVRTFNSHDMAALANRRFENRLEQG